MISVITVVKNGVSSLEKTLLSVLNQNNANLELIVIDGFSSDGTIEIIQRYQKHIKYWVSEPDNGIYDAMNKGIDNASGDFLFFLNSGDYIVGDVLSKVTSAPIFLPVMYKSFSGKIKYQKITSYLLGLPISHQGIIFENKGIKYDLDYKISSDYDFYLNHSYRSKIEILKTSGYVYYDNNGYSKVNYLARDAEISKIIFKNFGFSPSFLFNTIQYFKKIIRLIFFK